ncbi:MAG: pitrilysin family protein [Myxococcota bacterium]|nr:pitrilysin family protein [Myxococcota bacterium]
MSRLHVFIALAFVVPFQSQADVGTPTAEQVPSNTQSKTANPPTVDVETWVLDNGLTVLLSRDTRLPVVAVEVRYMVGSAHEKVGRSGFAHLFEHLMFQGSQNYNDEYFKPLQPIGAAINGTTSVDRTNYYERVPKEYLELALWLESDRMENLLPALTMKKLDNQRDVVKNERRQSYEDRPYGRVWLHLYEQLYPKKHPYGHPTIGSHADLTAASLDDVKSFFKQHYSATNAIVTIAGDFEMEQAKALVRRYFGHLPRGKRTPWPKHSPASLATNKHIVDRDEVKLPMIVMAWHTPALYAKGDSEMDILASVLSAGKTSRLYKPLVFDQKIATRVNAYQVSMALGSFFVVQAVAAPGTSIEDLKGALKKALGDALATKPSVEEMAKAINAYKKSFYGRVESVLSRAQLLSTYHHIKGRADYLGTDLARYTELTADTVFEAANLWLQKPHLRIDVLPVEEPAKTAPTGGAK